MGALFECPLWVISGQTIAGQNPHLSAIVRQRTKFAAQRNDAMCQKRPVHRSKQCPYSITSSAMESILCGASLQCFFAALARVNQRTHAWMR